MLIKDLSEAKKQVIDCLEAEPQVIKGNLVPVVDNILSKRDALLSLVQRYPTPFFVIDQAELEDSIQSFKSNFAVIPNFQAFYAMKSNPHPQILKTVANAGLGIDVSSSRELNLALKAGASKILFTGPGKTEDDLNLALDHNDIITINIDSFNELEKLGKLTNKRKQTIRAGVRIYTKYHGKWIKFGIPLSDLRAFWQKAQKFPYIKLQGIQVHMSWNETTKPYENVLKELSQELGQWTPQERKKIKYFDFGGGYLPYMAEAYYPWDLLQGKIIKTAYDNTHKTPEFTDKYYISPAVPLHEYAQKIAQSIKVYLEPLLDCAYYAEPGRILCYKAMHVVLKIVDVKSDDLVITDGGINMVGWEAYEDYYFPLINLTHPAKEEKNVWVCGSLCTPRDFWGYYCYMDKMCENDIIVVPNQGAYTYTLTQNFIKPIPKVYILKDTPKDA